MKANELLSSFVITFGVTLGTAALVTYLWRLVFHEAGAVNWEVSMPLAVGLGVALPLARVLRGTPFGKG